MPIDYKKQRLDPRWQRKRLEILERDKFTCKQCGRTDITLHVHHLYYITGRDYWSYPDGALETICKDCHKLDFDAEGDFHPNGFRFWEVLVVAEITSSPWTVDFAIALDGMAKNSGKTLDACLLEVVQLINSNQALLK